MNFIEPLAGELDRLRPDPLIFEEELDFLPRAATALEQAAGGRSGRFYWRSEHDHLYCLELGDLGRGRPSTATVFGHWDRYEPRPPEHEIDRDLMVFHLWFAAAAGLDPDAVAKVAARAGLPPSWPAGAVLRTPEERFANLPGFDYAPQYAVVEDLRMAYVEAGEGDPILMLHGEPTWGYLYRRMIPALAQVGRVVVPDLIGFGRSDKPAAANAYSFRAHVRWMRKFIEQLGLERITLVCQDWGGLIGLRVLAENSGRFARLAATHTGLGRADANPGQGFRKWRAFSQRTRFMDVPRMMARTLVKRREAISEDELAAYGAPFPGPEYQTAALLFPRLVPIRPDHPGAFEAAGAVASLRKIDIPVFLPWGDSDPITVRGRAVLQDIFPHAVAADFPGGGHFIQEDCGEELADSIGAWMKGSLC